MVYYYYCRTIYERVITNDYRKYNQFKINKRSDVSILTALVNDLSQRGGQFLGIELASEISFKKRFKRYWLLR